MTEPVIRGPIRLVKGDITVMDTDAIVNPSNTGLILGAGVSGAIAARGGPSIQEEMNKLGGCPVGGAKWTTAGKLKARYVIHAVGPRMGEGEEDEKLRAATREALKRAEELNLATIAFPAISTGIFGFPLERCANDMFTAVLDHFNSGESRSLTQVTFCLWDGDAFSIFARQLEEDTRP